MSFFFIGILPVTIEIYDMSWYKKAKSSEIRKRENIVLSMFNKIAEDEIIEIDGKMKTSNYRAKKGEANFGKPISTQVSGGTHITFEMITKKGKKFYMTRWPQGLPGHDDPKNALRFPHGLIKFGESLEQCAQRLVSKQLGMRVKQVEILYWDSYIDKHNHWHIEPGCLVEVAGKPIVPNKATEIVAFSIDNLPDMTFWEHSEFIEAVECKLV